MVLTNSTRDTGRNRTSIWFRSLYPNITERLRLAKREHIGDPLVGGTLIGFGAFLYDILGKALHWTPY